jgi:hypothetical protein
MKLILVILAALAAAFGCGGLALFEEMGMEMEGPVEEVEEVQEVPNAREAGDVTIQRTWLSDEVIDEQCGGMAQEAYAAGSATIYFSAVVDEVPDNVQLAVTITDSDENEVLREGNFTTGRDADDQTCITYAIVASNLTPGEYAAVLTVDEQPVASSPFLITE